MDRSMSGQTGLTNRIEYEMAVGNTLFHSTMFITGIILSLIMMLAASFLTEYYQSLNLRIAAFIVFTISSVWSVDFEILHPFVWFNIPFLLYSVSAPVLYSIGESYAMSGTTERFIPVTTPQSFLQALNLQYLAVLASSLVIGHKVISHKKMNMDKFPMLAAGNNWFFIPCLVLAAIYLIFMASSGIQAKEEKLTSFSPIFFLDFVYCMMNVSMGVYLIKSMYRQLKLSLKSKVAILGYVVFLAFSFLICGARSIIFEFGIIFIFIYHAFYKKIKKKYACTAFFLGVYASTILGMFKMYLVSGKMLGELTLNLSIKDTVLVLLSSEFRTGSENLALLVDYVPKYVPFFMGQSFLWDIRRALLPGFLFHVGDFMNTTVWFSQRFFPTYWKWGVCFGFTLVGLGYVNFGVCGVVFLFSVIGLTAKKIYQWSAKSIWGFIFYVSFIPTFIYSIRADLSTLIARPMKHILLPLTIILFFGSLKKTLCGQNKNLPETTV